MTDKSDKYLKRIAVSTEKIAKYLKVISEHYDDDNDDDDDDDDEDDDD